MLFKYIKNNYINKLLYSVIAIFVLNIAIINFNYANNVKTNTIKVDINNVGDAYITQIWEGYFNEGTENYIPINTAGIEVSDLNVTLINNNGIVSYQNVGTWDINWSFNQKKYKCGYNKISDGLELCFGISDLGYNKYEIKYLVKNLVKSYKDLDGFNFMFVNKELNTTPTDVDVYINLPLINGKEIDIDKIRAWGFGFKGNVNINTNLIHAYTTEDIKKENYVIIMASFEKGIFSPTYNVNLSFDELKKNAFKGSDYGYLKNLDFNTIVMYIIFGLLFFLSTFISLYAIIKNILNKIKIKKIFSNCPYFRDVPNGSNIFVSHVLLLDYTSYSKENIIPALIMKLIHEKCLEQISVTEYGLFIVEKKTTSLKLIKEPDDEMLKRFYSILVSASGTDQILQSKELEKYANKHYQEFLDLFDEFESEGRKELSNKHCYKKIGSKWVDDLTENGIKELNEIFGLRKFLEEYSLISERDIEDITIWENYLIYACLFGISKKLLKTLKKLYPDKIAQIEQLNTNIDLCDVYYTSMWTRGVMNQVMLSNRGQFSRTSGFGGSSSLGGGGFSGGGGGFSGGGIGGGSR